MTAVERRGAIEGLMPSIVLTSKRARAQILNLAQKNYYETNTYITILSCLITTSLAKTPLVIAHILGNMACFSRLRQSATRP